MSNEGKKSGVVSKKNGKPLKHKKPSKISRKELIKKASLLTYEDNMRN
jgi:hypothetical protein